MDSTPSPKELMIVPMNWRRLEHGVWEAKFKGHRCTLTLNDFPDEHLYTICVDGKQLDLDDAPVHWSIEF